MALSAMAFATPLTVPEYPGDNCCDLYDAHEWQKSARVVKICRDLSSNEEKQAFDMRNYNFDDKVSSWYCGKYVEYDFCRNAPGSSCDGGNGDRGAGAAKSAYISK